MNHSASFQSFDFKSDALACADRLARLRALMAKGGLDGFVIPNTDPNQCEYPPEYTKRLAWLTAFTGSVGTAVVLAEKAVIFVDGRYTLQLRAQTDTSLFDARDLVSEGPAAWIAANLPPGAKLGYDPWLHSAQATEELKAATRHAGGGLVGCSVNPIDALWEDRPTQPDDGVVIHPLR